MMPAGSGGQGGSAAGAGGAASACPLAMDFWCDKDFATDLKTGLVWERDWFPDVQYVPLGCIQHLGNPFKQPTIAQWMGLSQNRDGAFIEPDLVPVSVMRTLDNNGDLCWSISDQKVVSCAIVMTTSRCVK
jgi:hypothetical protein